MKIFKSKSLQSKFDGITVYTQTMFVKDIVAVYYVAVRGMDKEKGAVQRVLNPRRIKEIREYILSGHIFYNTFILNWTNEKNNIEYNKGEISIPIIPSSAQVIDGQHRLEGLKAAMEINPSVGEKEVLVTLTKDITTKKAAEIFLNINTEQKPVPKSLIYDLYGLVESNAEHAINRAKDIVLELNENENSAYYKAIKFPGMPRGAGILDLSSFITTLKRYLDPTGAFFNYNLTDLERQKIIFLNYFNAIRHSYDKKDMWLVKSKNPFLQSAGVVAAIQFFMEYLLIKCSEKKSFSTETFINLMQLDKQELLTQAMVKGMDGKSARQTVKDYLESAMLSNAPEQDEYEF